MAILKKEEEKKMSKIRIGLKDKNCILRVYSGKPGCACGCNGKYYSKTMEIEVLKGYTTADDKTNVERFPKMLNKVYKLFEKNRDKIYTYIGYEENYICLDLNENRTYTLYYQN